MNELHERLNAALDEDERLALACDSRRWKIGTTTYPDWGPHRAVAGTVIHDRHGEWPRTAVDDCSHICEENRGDDYGRMVFNVTGSGYLSSRHQPQAEHACRHDPAAVLRQVEAIRGLLTMSAEMLEDFPKDAPGRPTLEMMYEQTVGHLARAYGVEL